MLTTFPITVTQYLIKELFWWVGGGEGGDHTGWPELTMQASLRLPIARVKCTCHHAWLSKELKDDDVSAHHLAGKAQRQVSDVPGHSTSTGSRGR